MLIWCTVCGYRSGSSPHSRCLLLSVTVSVTVAVTVCGYRSGSSPRSRCLLLSVTVCYCVCYRVWLQVGLEPSLEMKLAALRPRPAREQTDPRALELWAEFVEEHPEVIARHFICM